jgi:hypothetical protein
MKGWASPQPSILGVYEREKYGTDYVNRSFEMAAIIQVAVERNLDGHFLLP